MNVMPPPLEHEMGESAKIPLPDKKRSVVLTVLVLFNAAALLAAVLFLATAANLDGSKKKV